MDDEKSAESNETTSGTTAWKATFDDKRSITAWDMGDGSFFFKFQNDENVTEIRLSREAVNAMKALMLFKFGGIDA
jgi:hypothetical protein